MGRPSREPEAARFILENVSTHPADIVAFTARTLALTRQSTHRYARALVSSGQLTVQGGTRPTYALPPVQVVRDLSTETVEEDLLWSELGAALVRYLPQNIRSIAQHGFTEMVNNVRDHSGSRTITVSLERQPKQLEIVVMDSGIGIFEKIRRFAGLDSAAQAVLELSKGKFTTDPSRHSGEGIFFTSRIFDDFSILSGQLYFSHHRGEDDWLLERGKEVPGTHVSMKISTNSTTTMESVYNQFSTSPEDADFSKTVIAVRLMQSAGDELVSRSQAKRLLARLTRFKEVVFDFEGVNTIGQAFADEIFRVFRMSHPEIRFVPIRMNDAVMRMVSRAQTAFRERFDG